MLCVYLYFQANSGLYLVIVRYTAYLDFTKGVKTSSILM